MSYHTIVGEEVGEPFTMILTADLWPTPGMRSAWRTDVILLGWLRIAVMTRAKGLSNGDVLQSKLSYSCHIASP